MLVRIDQLFRKPAVLGLAVAAAFTVTLVAPVAAGAATSNVPNASVQLAGGAVQPAGHVQATLLTPQPPRKSSGAQSPPFHTMNPAALQAAKLKAAGPSQGPSGNPSRISAPPSVGAIFNALNSPGLSANDEGNAATPPDSTGAIGPTRYVEMVNQLVGVFDRSNLARLSQLDLGSFTAVPAGLTTSDPQIQWDPQANRWFYGAIGFATGNNYLLFGWSKTADPSDLKAGWCRYGISTGSNLQDYPKLGHDANFLTVGSNVYDDSKAGFPFVTANIWAISKPAAGDSTCSSGVSAIFFADANHLLKNSDGSLAFTPVPANTADAATNDYIVAAHDVSVTSQSKVMVWHMTPGPLLMADGDVSVGSSYSVPPSIPQPGVGYLLDSLDGRLTQAVAHFDPSAGAEAVWTQHTVAGSGRTVVRWYEFLPATLAIRQQGQLASATDFYWNAAISPTSAGSNAAIFYNRGSSSLLAVIGAQTRMSSTPLGQMDAGEVLLGSSSAADQETGFTGNCTPNPCRWGDYSGATPDPINAGVVWGSNQLSGPAFPLGLGFAQWTTQNFAVTTSISSTPSVSGTVRDAAGVPVAGASVQAYLGGTGAVCCTFVSAGLSDSNGNYSFAVPAGTYKIWINPPAPFAQQWNGGTDFAGATPITVNGSTLVNVTLTGNFIRGTVKDAAGVPVAGASVQAYIGSTGAVCCTFVSGALTDSNGNYSFAVPVGTYKIWINPPAPFAQRWNGGTTFAGATPIIVNGSTLVNITLTGNFIRGTVKDAAGVPVAGASVQAYVGGTGAVCCTFVSSASSDSDGNYSFAVPVGTYKIWINPPAPFAQQWNGGTTFAGATPIIVNGSTLVNIGLHA